MFRELPGEGRLKDPEDHVLASKESIVSLLNPQATFSTYHILSFELDLEEEMGKKKIVHDLKNFKYNMKNGHCIIKCDTYQKTSNIVCYESI